MVLAVNVLIVCLDLKNKLEIIMIFLYTPYNKHHLVRWKEMPIEGNYLENDRKHLIV